MTPMEIQNKIRQFILDKLYFAEDGFLGDEDSFLETGVIDSMGVMELVAFIESEFAVKVALEEIEVENFDSVRKLADFVRRKLPLKEAVNSSQTAKLTGASSLASR
jgi:acyl carrier protein